MLSKVLRIVFAVIFFAASAFLLFDYSQEDNIIALYISLTFLLSSIILIISVIISTRHSSSTAMETFDSNSERFGSGKKHANTNTRILVDIKGRKFALKTSTGFKTFDFPNLIEYKMVENDKNVIKSTKSQLRTYPDETFCRNLRLFVKLKIEDGVRPEIEQVTHDYIFSRCDKNSSEYRIAMDRALQALSALDYITKHQ